MVTYWKTRRGRGCYDCTVCCDAFCCMGNWNFHAHGRNNTYKLGCSRLLSWWNLIQLYGLVYYHAKTLPQVLALLLRGDMNLSILMTSVSTVVGIGAIPFMLKFISGFFLDECSKIEDATLNIIVSLLATLAPCGLGMLIKERFSCFFVSLRYSAWTIERLNVLKKCATSY